MRPDKRTSRHSKIAEGNVFVFLRKWILLLYNYTLGTVFNLLTLIVKHQLLVWKLRTKHKQLTKQVSVRLLTDQIVADKLQSHLQLTDNLIVHNASIVLNCVLLFFLPLFLICMFVFSIWHSNEVPVSIDVRASAVMWRVANADPGTPSLDWNMLSNSTNEFTDTVVLDPDNNPSKVEKALDILPRAENNLIEIYKLPLPDKCSMAINFSDSSGATINYIWQENRRAPYINWELKLHGRQLNYGGTMLLDSNSKERIITLQKKLQRNALYNIKLQDVLKWRLQRPIRVSELFFNTEPGTPQSRPSIISGKVGLLNIKDKDSLIVLNEGDKLRIHFKEPVDIYLSTEPGYIKVRTKGIVTSLDCGPEALGLDTNKMPRLLKSLTDESPYLLTMIGIIVPLLIAMLVRQRKSI